MLGVLQSDKVDRIDDRGHESAGSSSSVPREAARVAADPRLDGLPRAAEDSPRPLDG